MAGLWNLLDEKNIDRSMSVLVPSVIRDVGYSCTFIFIAIRGIKKNLG
jgi:hypothetical protein